MPRRKNGNPLTTQQLGMKKTLTNRLRLGHTWAQIRKSLGLKPRELKKYLQDFDLIDPPPEYVTRVEVSTLLGMGQHPTLDLLATLGVPTFKWGKLATILEEDLDRVLNSGQGVKTVQVIPEGCYTAQQIAEHYGFSVKGFRTRISQRRIKPTMLLRNTENAGRLPLALYTLEAVALLLPSAAKTVGVPRGWLVAKQLGPIVGLKDRSITSWAVQGCPHIKVMLRAGGQGYAFNPLQVIQWLEALPTRGVVYSAPYKAHLLKQWALVQPHLKELVAA